LGAPEELWRRLAEPARAISNAELRRWKADGGKVIGYFCSYIPPEIITAAGLLPFRMRASGSTETALGDVYFANYNCTFPRHCLDMAFRGEYDFLDGLICLNNCDHLRRIYDVWESKFSTAFRHFVSVPHKSGPPQVDWYRDELAILRQRLSEHLGRDISDASLWRAIGEHNKARRLQQELYGLRRGDRPPVTGAQTLALVIAGTAMPVSTYNALLREFLDAGGAGEAEAQPRARLMLIGGILDDPAYIKVIEDLGALVVTDSLCFGTRIAWREVAESGGDPLRALAQYYVGDRVHCPRMIEDYPKRLAFVREMVEAFRVDGAVLERLQFCELWGGENFRLARDLRASGVPALVLEREYRLTGAGQLRTRAQAFLETIGR